MRRELLLALCAFPGAVSCFGRQTAASSAPASAIPSEPTVYYAGPEVVAPEMLPLDVSVTSPKHCSDLSGMVRLTAVVDANGAPQAVKAVMADNANLGSFAKSLVAKAQFKPGSYNGVPSATAIEITLALQTCILSGKKSANGQETLALKAHPLQSLALQAASIADKYSPSSQVGEQISAPVALYSPEPRFSDYARRKHICGISAIGLIVDAYGMPQNVHVTKSLEPSLDEKAMEAVRQYRFKPALKDGSVPVPVEITIEVNFHLYKRDKYTPDGCSPEYPDVTSHSPTADNSMVPSILISGTEPGYSDDEHKQQVTDSCILQATIDTKGIPQNVHVVKGLDPRRDAIAIEAVQKWHYTPTIKDGVLVPVNLTVQVQFVSPK